MHSKNYFYHIKTESFDEPEFLANILQFLSWGETSFARTLDATNYLLFYFVLYKLRKHYHNILYVITEQNLGTLGMEVMYTSLVQNIPDIKRCIFVFGLYSLQIIMIILKLVF